LIRLLATRSTKLLVECEELTLTETEVARVVWQPTWNHPLTRSLATHLTKPLVECEEPTLLTAAAKVAREP
jgi:hypothetical protein